MVDCDFYGDLDSTEFFERDNKTFTIQPIKVEKVNQFKLLSNSLKYYVHVSVTVIKVKSVVRSAVSVGGSCRDIDAEKKLLAN